MSLQIDTNKVPSRARVSINALLAENEQVLCAGQAKVNTVGAVLAQDFWYACLPVALFCFLATAPTRHSSGLLHYWISHPVAMLSGCAMISVCLAVLYCACAAALNERNVAYVLTKERILVVDSLNGNLMWSCALERVERIHETKGAGGRADISIQLSLEQATLLPRNNKRYLPAVDNPEDLMTAFRAIAKSKLPPQSEQAL